MSIKMRSLAIGLLAAAALPAIFWLIAPHYKAVAYDAGSAPAAPEFTHRQADDWINSPPLTLAGLRGKVVMLDIWTFDCWNCYRSFPWLKSVEQTYQSRGLRVIGVHTPEFDHERVRANIERKVAEFGLPHPIMIDNDFSYWKSLGNRYWPTYYLIDKNGRMRARFIGETHSGTAKAKRIEEAIAELLTE